MKHLVSKETVILSQLIVAALAIQGCRTYNPNGRTAFVDGLDKPTGQGDVPVVAGTGGDLPPATTDGINPMPVEIDPLPVPVDQVGTPGTYKEFIVKDANSLVNPYAGLKGSSTKHTPLAGTSTAPTLSADGKYMTYVVKRGDTAGQIANSHGLTRAAFVALNDIKNPNLIRVGQKVKVPADGKPLAAGPKKVTAPSTLGAGMYAVKSGDTLSEIAAAHSMKTKALMDLNGITNANMIRVGQKLRVSASVKPAVSAPTVKPEPKTTTVDVFAAPPTPPEPDTTDADSDSDVLVDLTTSLGAGTSLLEAKKEIEDKATVVVEGTQATVAEVVESAQHHTVQAGEDVYSLAMKYGVTPMQIRRENDLTSSTVQPGTVLRIPAKK